MKDSAEAASAEGYSAVADVAVIGAGAAGLAAARRLAEAGRSVLLLEARDRMGGRIWTVGDGIELGAEFVHGEPEATLALLREAGIGMVELAGERWVMHDGRPRRAGALMGHEVHWLLERAAHMERDMSVAEFLESAVRADPGCDVVAARIQGMAEGYDAADPSRASIRALAAEWAGGASPGASSRLRGGYVALMDHMTRMLDRALVELRLESVVRVVRWSSEGVEIDVEERGALRRHRARKAIITLPLGVLQAPPDDPAAVRFEPPLEMKREALAGLSMGPAHRVVLKFRGAFWEKLEGGSMRNAGFITTAGTSTGTATGTWSEVTKASPFRTFWTELPARRRELVAWVGGPAAVRASERANDSESDGAAKDTIIAQAIYSVQSLFAGRVDVERLLEGAWFHDWVSDPLARGAYSYVNVGGERARSELAEPVAGTLYIAGEATDDSGEATTVAGAIAEGTRVAGEVVDGWQRSQSR